MKPRARLSSSERPRYQEKLAMQCYNLWETPGEDLWRLKAFIINFKALKIWELKLTLLRRAQWGRSMGWVLNPQLLGKMSCIVMSLLNLTSRKKFKDKLAKKLLLKTGNLSISTCSQRLTLTNLMQRTSSKCKEQTAQWNRQRNFPESSQRWSARVVLKTWDC